MTIEWGALPDQMYDLYLARARDLFRRYFGASNLRDQAGMFLEREEVVGYVRYEISTRLPQDAEQEDHITDLLWGLFQFERGEGP